MCPPDYFGVEYSINPWMTGNMGRVDPERAKKTVAKPVRVLV